MKKNVALLALALPVLAFAQSPVTPQVDQRQARQEARIQQGVRSGTLTEQEAARLDRGQDRVANIEARAKADGSVTPRERARLRQAQDKQSGRIYRQKHDAKTDRNHDGKVDHARKPKSIPQ